MAEILRLTRIDFDNLENRDCILEKLLGVFLEGNGKTAYGNAAMWFKQQPPVKLYTGYNNQVYPQFELKPIKDLGKEIKR